MTRKRNKPATTQKAPRRKTKPKETFEKYPVEQGFETIEQVNDYLGQQKITCLLCGKKLCILGKHLFSVHGLTSDQYRERYGIPWTRALAVTSTRSRMEQALRKRLESGDQSLNPMTRELSLSASHKKRRSKPKSVLLLDKAKLEKCDLIESICECGTIFFKGPHQGSKKMCDECRKRKYPYPSHQTKRKR